MTGTHTAEKLTRGFKDDLNMSRFIWKPQSVPQARFYFSSVKGMHKPGRLLKEQYKRRQTFPKGPAVFINFILTGIECEHLVNKNFGFYVG